MAEKALLKTLGLAEAKQGSSFIGKNLMQTLQGGRDGQIDVSGLLKNYPALNKVYNQSNLVVIPQRQGVAGQGQLEFYPPFETGTPEAPHPAFGKHAIEIYNKELLAKGNEHYRDQAILGDLLHGMRADPQWNLYRNQFTNSFTPKQLEFIQKNNVEGAAGTEKTLQQHLDHSVTDAFIRSQIVDYMGGNAEWKQPGLFTPEQTSIVNTMRNYLQTGK